MKSPESGVKKAPSTFRALSHPNYRLFFFGQMISLVGTWMQRIAQQWLVYRLTGSSSMLGMINLVVGLPLIPLSLWGGSLADRLSRRAIMVGTQSTMMVLSFILAGLTWTDVVSVWHVFLLAMGLGAATAVNIPAQQALVVELVEGKEDLTNAIGLNSALFNGARALGPAIGGAIVAITGEGGAFFINGISFIAVIISLLMIRLPTKPQFVDKSREVGSHLREALRYVLEEKRILILMTVVAVSSFLSMPFMVLLPVFGADVLKESAQPLIQFVCTGSNALFDCESPDALTYGLLMAATGLGAVSGALFVAWLPDRVRRGWWMAFGSLVFPSLLVAMAISRSIILTSVLLVGIGWSFVVQNTLANTLIQLTVPDLLRGRVLSFYSLTFQGMMVAGGMMAGVMGDIVGAALTVGVGALIGLGYSALVVWRFPQIRDMA